MREHNLEFRSGFEVSNLVVSKNRVDIYINHVCVSFVVPSRTGLVELRSENNDKCHDVDFYQKQLISRLSGCSGDDPMDEYFDARSATRSHRHTCDHREGRSSGLIAYY